MGGKSKAFGNMFEDMFQQNCRSNGVAITRIPDGCRQAGKHIIRVKTPWDWVLTYKHKTALIDTKTVNSDVFNCSLITEHQVRELHQHERLGAVAGYVIWLRESNRVFFIPAGALANEMKRVGSFSDAHPQAIYLGTQMFDVRPIFGIAMQS